MKIPIVDLSECVLCGVCVDVAPEIFRLNSSGFIEVLESPDYDRPDVADAMKHCPASCISWEETL